MEFNKALDNSPGHLTILYVLGSCLFETDHMGKAITIFEEIIAADSTHGWALMDLGNFYFYRGNFNSAIDYYHQAIRHMPRNESLYSSLGKAYYWAGDKRKSHEAFTSAISIARDDYESALKRGHGSMEISHSPLYKSLSQNKDFNEMIEISRKATLRE